LRHDQGFRIASKTPDIGNDVGGALGATFNNAQDGNFYLDLSGSYLNSAHARVQQDFATVPLTTYQLSFYIGASGQQAPAQTIDVEVFDGFHSYVSSILTPLPPSTNIHWSLQTFTFTAQFTSARLTFHDVSNSDDNASFVDNVSIVALNSAPPTAVPAPPSAILAMVGFVGLAVNRRLRGRRQLVALPS
jgi:Protein of unknown function (DUF642)